MRSSYFAGCKVLITGASVGIGCGLRVNLPLW